MRRLGRALAAYFTPGSCLTWRTCWRHAKDKRRFHVVARDGFRYVEPVVVFTSEREGNRYSLKVEVLSATAARRRLAGVPQDVQ